ncbi:hypothetical protein [Adhaeribacter radiodurans]|uniref:Uncharacterized protein n=1 Tax=Adhaeribacter radiodurans TaxID=2745197 RepID=A0A7L7L2I3_9BACT|nr:hypothetical protein [Adhaeribacter radiodurans]QMU26659.1 hypothetical protein HUW48_00815 [Adhaeribacter radiodurans]
MKAFPNWSLQDPMNLSGLPGRRARLGCSDGRRNLSSLRCGMLLRSTKSLAGPLNPNWKSFTNIFKF